MTAHSSRNDGLHRLYTAIVWHLLGPQAARFRGASSGCHPASVYLDLMLRPQIIGAFVGGLPRISRCTLHLDHNTGRMPRTMKQPFAIRR